MVSDAVAPWYAYFLGVYLGDGYLTVVSPRRSVLRISCARGVPRHRRIALDTWQRAITHAHPDRLVRGLMHSDGCRFLARQPRRGRIYTYPRYYSFSNRSEDIKRILCEHLDRLGVAWTRPNAQQIQVALHPHAAGPTRANSRMRMS
jgi:hypothetical protein